MSHGVEITAPVLERRIIQLREIVADIDQMLDGSWFLPVRQHSGRWTTNTAAQQFVQTYRTRLTDAEDALRSLRSRVQDMSDELRATAESFNLLEGTIESELNNLDELLEDVPERRVSAGGGHQHTLV